jgi:glutathione S-transferase
VDRVLRLITIPISHYCEKARWALERAGLPYREERHLQGFHRVAARRAGGGSTVPVLVTDRGAIGESEAILEWVDRQVPAERRLFPVEPQAREQTYRLCRRFDAELGPTARRLIYVHMLEQRELALRFNNRGAPRWEDRALRWGWPAAAGYIRRELGIRPGIELEDEMAVWREFDFVGSVLEESGRYLSGDRFGAADLTFAALSAPMIAPPVYGTPLPAPELMAPATAALIARAREHPAGAFAMRLYEEERVGPMGQSPADGASRSF